MLQNILIAMTDMYCRRYYSNTIYCGYGTYIDGLLAEADLSLKTIKRLDALAYKKANQLMKEYEESNNAYY